MTGRQLISLIQNLGEENLDREIVMFDGPSHYTPYKVEILKEEQWHNLAGKILID